MNEATQFFLHHGYSLLFLGLLANQLGVPVPATPLLLAAGVLVEEGWIRFPPAFLLLAGAAVAANLFWYWVGRSKGGAVLSLACRISLNPESCVRKTASHFSRYGARSLLVAKFIPGLSTIAPPAAGVFRMPLGPFLFYDGLGAAIWVGSLMGAGYGFSRQLEAVFRSAPRVGPLLAAILFGGLAVFSAWKIVERRRFIRRVLLERISAEELKGKMDRGEDLVILDVRHPLELRADPRGIPGALYRPLEELKEEDASGLGEREAVVYCD